MPHQSLRAGWHLTLKRNKFRAPHSVRGFTMIEIALCLAIIGFALVAIISALPRGLDVEKRNREETIIGQDATLWMNLIRNGAQGSDDLTNYVLCITNYWTTYNTNGSSPMPPWGAGATLVTSGVDWYTATNSSEMPFVLANGACIVGLLSTPKWLSPPQFARSGNYQSNYVVAYVRAFSGAEVTKVPQTNSTILNDAFIYRMIVENFPYVPVDTNAFCMNCPATNGLTSNDMWLRTNLVYAQEMLQTNTHDLRLRFRYPVLPSGEIPNYGMATFRDMADGQMTNYPFDGQPLYFIQPSLNAQLTTSTPRPAPPL